MTYEYERVATPSSGLRLHLNENTAGCSPQVLEVLRNMRREDAAFYPDYDAAIDACAQTLRVSPDELVLTNGLDEGILAASVAALRGGGAAAPFEAVVVVPAFDMYAACADAAAGRVVEVPLGSDFEFRLDAVLAAITPRTRLIFLTDPNNPTGQSLPDGAVRTIAEAAPGAIVFLDEAYIDFAGGSFLESRDFRRLENVVVGRTFAKAYGLAGLRIGAVAGVPRVLETIRRVVPPYSVNACAALALPVALNDRAQYEWYVGQVAESRSLLYDALTSLDVQFWRSDANFVLARFGARCRDVIAALADKGIHVRDKSGDPACAGCVRITAGVVDHTREAIAAIQEVM